MATVLRRTTKQFRRSVNTPDFDPADWIINPDVDAVIGAPTKYWLISGDVVSLMDQAAQDVVDATEEQAATDADRISNKSRIDDERVLKALALVVLDEVNVLRGEHSLADRTSAQLVGAIKTKIEGI